jgi:hypothetical protein
VALHEQPGLCRPVPGGGMMSPQLLSTITYHIINDGALSKQHHTKQEMIQNDHENRI